MPVARLDAFRLVRLVPGPQKPVEVTIPDTLKLVVIETSVPLSVISELPIWTPLGVNLARVLTVPEPVIIQRELDEDQATPEPVEESTEPANPI